MASNKPTYEELEKSISALQAELLERDLQSDYVHTDNHLFQTIIDLLAEPVFIKDNDHQITHANKAFYTLFELDEKDVIGFTLVEAVPKSECEHFLKVDRKVLDTGKPDFQEEELTIDGSTHIILTSKRRYTDTEGNHFLVGSIQDITELKQSEKNLLAEKEKLQKALDEVNTLRGILPICAHCKKIRDDEGYWQQIESYISKHSEATFSHGICQDCVKKHYPDFVTSK
ncbi:MAG: PAS domain-containing protein [Gammaproteobacteria bacterium]|nr:PAS domain-containing protein [Gammaproteobacteria bacterium]NNJ73201.1 PAS domain-containing protein [Enterobacterales bacterium]